MAHPTSLVSRTISVAVLAATAFVGTGCATYTVYLGRDTVWHPERDLKRFERIAEKNPKRALEEYQELLKEYPPPEKPYSAYAETLATELEKTEGTQTLSSSEAISDNAILSFPTLYTRRLLLAARAQEGIARAHEELGNRDAARAAYEAGLATLSRSEQSWCPVVREEQRLYAALGLLLSSEGLTGPALVHTLEADLRRNFLESEAGIRDCYSYRHAQQVDATTSAEIDGHLRNVNWQRKRSQDLAWASALGAVQAGLGQMQMSLGASTWQTRAINMNVNATKSAVAFVEKHAKGEFLVDTAQLTERLGRTGATNLLLQLTDPKIDGQSAIVLAFCDEVKGTPELPDPVKSLTEKLRVATTKLSDKSGTEEAVAVIVRLAAVEEALLLLEFD